MPVEFNCPKCGVRLVGMFTMAGMNAATPQTTERRAPSPKLSKEQFGELELLLEQIKEDDLDAYPAEFVRKTRAAYEKYGDRTRISEKQMAWLRDISNGKGRKDDWSE